MKSVSRRRSKQRGTVVIAYAAMIFGILGFSGLAVDAGYLQYEKRKLQAAADAAAMGALRELERGQTDLVAAGQNDASLNGFTNGQNSTTVAINNPPTSGAYASNTAAVQAIVQRQIPTFFMMLFGQNSVVVSAHAVALTTNAPGSIGGCIFALDATANNTFEISGSSVVTTSCSAVVNSNSSKAFVNSGGGQLNLGNGAKIGVVGNPPSYNGWDISGGSTVTNSTTNQSESPVNIQSFSDPLANVSPPTMPVTGGVQSNNTLNIDSIHMPANNQLNPGVYCNGISIQSTSGTLTFNAGTYVIAGGGLTISSNATVAGTGVMFYNTYTSPSAAWGCSATNFNAKSIMIQGGQNSVTLSAPTNQSPIGVLFFEDRSIAVGKLSNQVTGGSSGTFNGALYFRNNQLTFSGGSSASNGYLVIVADIITISGTSKLGNDYSSLGNVYTLAPASTGGGLVE